MFDFLVWNYFINSYNTYNLQVNVFLFTVDNNLKGEQSIREHLSLSSTCYLSLSST